MTETVEHEMHWITERKNYFWKGRSVYKVTLKETEGEHSNRSPVM